MGKFNPWKGNPKLNFLDFFSLNLQRGGMAEAYLKKPFISPIFFEVTHKILEKFKITEFFRHPLFKMYGNKW
jgi:hypothetical protein